MLRPDGIRLTGQHWTSAVPWEGGEPGRKNIRRTAEDDPAKAAFLSELRRAREQQKESSEPKCFV